MVIAYGDSFTVFCSPVPGTTEWPFQMKDGYISQRYVKMRYLLAGDWYDVQLTRSNFKAALTLVTLPLPASVTMVDVYRDTPKDSPIVIYGNGGTILADESRNAAARQSIHVVAELVDLARRQGLDCMCEAAEEVAP